MAFKKIKIFLNKLREYESLKQYGVLANKKTSLELYLLSFKDPTSLEEKIEVIVTIVQWIFRTELLDPEPEKVPSIKIKQLFSILDKNLVLKSRIQKVFSSALQELHSTEFFCEVGLPSNLGLIGELTEKLTSKILPGKPIGNQLSELMMVIFPSEESPGGLRGLDEECLRRLPELFAEGEYSKLQNDIDDSLIYLISQITAIGMSPAIRKRIPHKKMKALPFYSLPSKLNLYLKSKNENALELNQVVLVEFYDLLLESGQAIDDVYHHLNTYGVSTQIVFQLEKMKLFLKRVHSLLELTNSKNLNPGKITKLIAELVEQNLHQRNALSVFSDNATLLAQKIISPTKHVID